MNQVEIRAINVETPQWIAGLWDFCIKILSELDKHGWEVSVILCNDEFIRDLNNRYRNMDNPTDVLTFPQLQIGAADSHVIGGDIIISLGRSAENAHAFHQTHEKELKRLVVHGMLHLCGMNHDDTVSNESVGDLSEMLAHQERILQKHSEEPLF